LEGFAGDLRTKRTARRFCRQELKKPPTRDETMTNDVEQGPFERRRERDARLRVAALALVAPEDAAVEDHLVAPWRQTPGATA